MFNVGEIEILRIEESLGHGFQPNVLLPDWNAKDIEPHLPWLAPTYYDPQPIASSPAFTAGCSRLATTPS